MATLLRHPLADTAVPAPFPTHLLDDINNADIRDCLVAVERACLTTLANILALPDPPDRAQLNPDAIPHTQDAHLVHAILALLTDLDQLPPSLAPRSVTTSASFTSPCDTIVSLQQRLSLLQPSTSSSSIDAVRTALLWSRIDDQLDTVVSLCKARALPSFDDTLPPDYDTEFPYEHPPSYVDDFAKEMPSDEKRVSTEHSLDTMTLAIEKLYVVAPQLANQRVELGKGKITQMENAKIGKGKARSLADPVDPELDKILDLLGKASAREIPDQSVVIDPRRTTKGTVDIEEQRSQYLEHIVHRTHIGRLHSQDAIPSPGPLSEDETRGKRASFPNTLRSDASEISRNRSLSASHLAWLRLKDKSGLSLTTSDPNKSLSGRLRRVSKSRPRVEDVSHGALDIAYVAEHHETLKHVLLFITHASPSSAPNEVPSAEVLPSTSSATFGDCLFLRLVGTPSPPLALPVPVVPGSKTVLNRSGHWEVKAICYQGEALPKESEDVALLPASELASLSPSSYVCSSCSLPLVPAPPAHYRDLPSEHWEELIEAWMCHPDGQTLARTGNGKGNQFGFWPTRDEALVGGSYLLFDSEAVASGNIKCVGSRERGGNSRLTRCLCGAILGRQHDRKQEDSSISRMYRLFKYAIRPISAASQAPKIPMSAFVLHDMLEHVQAHATYRFVLSDDEEERPRLLIWLFKPRLRISYMLPTPALLPKSGTIDASKVLYKILGPTTSDFKEILCKYPGFPQAEYLFYPMDVCRKLAALLKESTTSYPDGMRTMTGLDVGWLTMRR